ncbi:MAG: DUF5694 domain-containing protein [Pseudomonadota bacterium]
MPYFSTKKIVLATVYLLCLCAQSFAQTSSTTKEDVEVMVLGTFHFLGGGGLISIELGDVLSPRRQEELDDLVKALATFEPDAIVLERVTDPPEYLDPYFADFDRDLLQKNGNERVQIGYRLASLIDATRVYGIDEQTSEGEPEYFPFDEVMALATENKSVGEIQATLAETSKFLLDKQGSFEKHTITEILCDWNNPDIPQQELYYSLLKHDVGERQPAAELNAYWYMRNAKIFSKIEDVTNPGDRVLIIYGSGHKYWLEHFAETTPGFKKVDAWKHLRLDDGGCFSGNG